MAGVFDPRIFDRGVFDVGPLEASAGGFIRASYAIPNRRELENAARRLKRKREKARGEERKPLRAAEKAVQAVRAVILAELPEVANGLLGPSPAIAGAIQDTATVVASLVEADSIAAMWAQVDRLKAIAAAMLAEAEDDEEATLLLLAA